METSAFAQHSTEAQANTGREKTEGGGKRALGSALFVLGNISSGQEN